jgi:hypothetical protein
VPQPSASRPPPPRAAQGDLLAAKQELEAALADARARLGKEGTVAELKTMVATLQREVEVLQSRLTKQQVGGAQRSALACSGGRSVGRVRTAAPPKGMPGAASA